MNLDSTVFHYKKTSQIDVKRVLGFITLMPGFCIYLILIETPLTRWLWSRSLLLAHRCAVLIVLTDIDVTPIAVMTSTLRSSLPYSTAHAHFLYKPS